MTNPVHDMFENTKGTFRSRNWKDRRYDVQGQKGQSEKPNTEQHEPVQNS